MNFKKLQQRTGVAEAEASKRSASANATRQTPAVNGSRSEEGVGGPISRVQRFEISTRGEPVFGGVVIGNRVHLEGGWKLISARIQQSSIEGQDPSPEIILRVERNGVTVDRSYSNLTSEELWSAYHVVRPLDSWKQEYDVRDQDSGMIGIAGHTSDGPDDKQVETGWTFGINPALANTLLAQDGMRLDMTVARLAVRVPSPTSPISPASIKLLNKAPYWSTYQWFDSPSIVKVSGGGVEVVAESNPTNILLRLRYIPAGTIVYPLYHFFTLSKHETQTSNELVEYLTQELDYARRIDRFAKTVAVLNLIADTSGVSFPALPPEVVQPNVPITAALTYDAEDKLLGLGGDRMLSDVADWLDVVLVVTILLVALAVFLIAVRYLYRRLRAKGRKLARPPVPTGTESAEHPI